MKTRKSTFSNYENGIVIDTMGRNVSFTQPNDQNVINLSVAINGNDLQQKPKRIPIQLKNAGSNESMYDSDHDLYHDAGTPGNVTPLQASGTTQQYTSDFQLPPPIVAHKPKSSLNSLAEMKNDESVPSNANGFALDNDTTNTESKSDESLLQNQRRHRNDRDDVLKWLQGIGLERYFTNFDSHGYESLRFVKEIKDKTDLEDIGIKMKGHQTLLMSEIIKLSNGRLLEGKSN